MRINLIPPFWLSINISRGPYSFCLNPHVGLFYTETTFDKGAKGWQIPISRELVSRIDKLRFPKTKDLTRKSSLKDLKERRDFYLKSAGKLSEWISEKEEEKNTDDSFSNSGYPRSLRAPQ